MSDFTSYSVIIRTRNSGEYLLRCLEGIQSQSIHSNEIVIVDTESTDNTISIAKRFGCKIINYPLNKYSFNYSKALNIGLEQAKTEYVLVISSHVWLPNTNSLKWMLEKLNEDNSIKAVSLSRSNESHRLSADIKIPFGTKISKSNFKGEGMYNYCALIRKMDWEQYKFREDIPTCEDQDWIWHWMKIENASSYIFQFPLAGYDNPNYNLAKDVQEIYTCGTYIYPPYMSFSNLLGFYKKAIEFLIQKKFKKANYHFKLGSTLLKLKFIPPKNLQSDTYLRRTA